MAPKSRNRVQKEGVETGQSKGAAPGLVETTFPTPPPPPVERGPDEPGIELPPELVTALLNVPDPYSLLGREYARRVQLEGVVQETQRFLGTLVKPEPSKN